ncbi:hypothetical protein CRUP_023800 [Coryphaenoides rupestris]|nr:hypothetical protein CRUP_023800 [Coryphaenoides rupestris]
MWKTPFQGDAWCDVINNRAYCDYDGGDCCSSSLSRNKVIQFGADCSQDECTCRDPDAAENQEKAQQGGAGGGAGRGAGGGGGEKRGGGGGGGG